MVYNRFASTQGHNKEPYGRGKGADHLAQLLSYMKLTDC